ncbi:acyl-ACP--UDP-N-acetylglucosamine O-acyltransferase [bacterium]|nr:acyl-ACP--UDP-N-acetylglucosamine O-acyltransferase [bacterium]
MAVIIHSTAIVHPQAQLGEDVEIGPGAIINAEAQIGDRTQVGAYALVDKWTTVGCDNKIFTGAIVGSECQDLKYRGEKSFAKIGDRNTIREYVTINRATDGELSTVIGNDNLIMTYAHVAHDCKIGNNNIMANAIAMAGHVTIMDHANIGGLNAIHQYVRIGSYAIIGGHSRVAKDVPPYIMCADSPLRIAGINKIGLERKGFTKDQIGIIEKAYRILYRSKLNTSQALVKLEAEARQHQEIELLVNFIKESERGIAK